MIKLERADLDLQFDVQRTGKMILDEFLEVAKKLNDERRKAAGNSLGLPIIHSEELATYMWYVDREGEERSIFIPDWYNGDTTSLPLEVMTGELTPGDYVERVWQEHYATQEKYKEDRKRRSLEELKKLVKEFPAQALEILAKESVQP